MLSTMSEKNPVSDAPPASAVTSLAKAVRPAQGDAPPSPTLTAVAQMVSEVTRVQALTAVRAPVIAPVLEAIAQVPGPRYELPEVTRMIDRLPTT